MPIAKKAESEIKKVNASNQLSQDVVETISDLSKRPDAETQKDEVSSSTAKYSDTVIARLTKGKRAEFKSFFSKYGVTMNSGIEMCIEYVMSQVDSGNAKISKAGVK